MFLMQKFKLFKKVCTSIPNVYFGKYSDLYLKLDMLTLAEVFESFRYVFMCSITTNWNVNIKLSEL